MSKANNTKTKTTISQKILLIGLATSLFVIIEIALRLLGAFPSYKIDDPFLGFHGIRPLFVLRPSHQPQLYVTNPNKLEFFNAQQFPAKKAEGTLRIFCFGGSTTYGRPYQAQTAFPAWLEILLNAEEPDHEHEVINAGGISYASYRILQLIKEAVKYEPDLFVVYTGHNEFLETITYSNLINQPQALKVLVRTLDKTRLYRLVRFAVAPARKAGRASQKAMPGEVEANLDRIGGFELYRRDEKQKRQILDQFQYNINRIIDICKDAGIPIVFIAPVSNVSDFSPFKSEPTAGLAPYTANQAKLLRQQAGLAIESGDFSKAKRLLDQAIALDADFASAHFLRGQYSERMEQIEDARLEYQAAIDLDVCPLRAVSEISAILEQTALQRRVPLIHIDSLFAARCDNGLLGKEIFIDHVHPTAEGHQLIAEQILAYLENSGFMQPKQILSSAERSSLYQKHIQELDSSYFAKGNLNLAKVLTWARKHAEALKPLQAAAALLPENLEAQRLLADTFARLHRYEEAAEMYERVLLLNPDDAQSWDNLCHVKVQLGQFTQAIHAGRTCVKLTPTNARYFATLASAFYQSKQMDSALVMYERAITLDSSKASLWNNLGKLYFSQGNFAQAEKSFQSAIRQNPDYVLAHVNLGRCYHAVGQYDKAAAVYIQALKLSPLDVKLQNALGITYLRQGKPLTAIPEFRKALQLDFNFTEAYQNLGTAYTLADKPDSGIFYFEQALSHLPSTERSLRAEVLSALGNAAAMSGDLPRAMSAWQECVQLTPNNIPVLFNLAIASSQQNNFAAALEYLQKAHELQPQNTKILSALGDVLIKLNRASEARKYYEQARQLTLSEK